MARPSRTTAAARRPTWSLLRLALRQNRKRLSALPNVDHLGIGTKRTKNRYTNTASIIVFVKAKRAVKEKHKIPARVKYTLPSGTVGFIATDVVKLRGTPRLFGMRAGDFMKAFDGDRGVCAMTFSRGQRKYAVTNAHVVLALRQGGATGPVSWIDWSSGNILGAGRVLKVTDFNSPLITADAALVELDNGVQADDWQILRTNFKITKVGKIIYDDDLKYFYVAGGEVVECDKPVGVPGGEWAWVSVDGQNLRYTDFWKLRVTKGRAIPGHSGALILRGITGGYMAAGVTFGGIEPQEIWAFSARKILDSLELGDLTVN